MPASKSKSKPELAPRIASAALSTWRAWGPAREQDYLAMIVMLPASSARPDFRLARAILERHRELAPPRKTRSTDMERSHSVEQAWEPGTSLALRDEFWGWGKAAIALRQRAFDEKDASLADDLAREMVLHPECPWRLWSCACPIAPALHAALDASRHREPAVENLGAMSLAAAMGFSGLPVSRWIGLVARISSPEAFVADSCSRSNFYFVQEIARALPEAFADLPTRRMCDTNYSRSLDFMELAGRPAAIGLTLSAMGISSSKERPAEPETLGPALESAFLRSTLSGAACGLPPDFDRKWPAYFALFSSHDRKPSSQAVGRGLSVLDLFEGLRIWEHAVEPYSETGSEGNFAPIDDELLTLLFDAGADFRSTRLSRAWGGSRHDLYPDRDMPLPEFYDRALESHRAGEARKLLAPWIARCDARELEENIPRAGVNAHSHARSL